MVEHVQLVDAEYDCERCGEIHTYKTSDEYLIHQGYRAGNKRWIYETIPADGRVATVAEKG